MRRARAARACAHAAQGHARAPASQRPPPPRTCAGFHAAALAERLAELAADEEAQRAALAAPYAQLLLGYSSFRRPQRDRCACVRAAGRRRARAGGGQRAASARNQGVREHAATTRPAHARARACSRLFEAVYGVLEAICRDAFARAGRGADAEAELGALLRGPFNAAAARRAAPRSVDTLTLEQILALKTEGGNRVRGGRPALLARGYRLARAGRAAALPAAAQRGANAAAPVPSPRRCAAS